MSDHYPDGQPPASDGPSGAWQRVAIVLALLLLGMAAVAAWAFVQYDGARTERDSARTRLASAERQVEALTSRLEKVDADTSPTTDTPSTIATPPADATPVTPSVIAVEDDYVTRLGDLKFTSGAQTLASFLATFGPTLDRDGVADACHVVWAGDGLTASFVDRASPTPAPCLPSHGLFDRATITGSRWQTDHSLAIGDSVARIKEIYPTARHSKDPYPGAYGDDTWWLATGSYGEEQYPTLVAVVLGGKVKAFRVYTGID